ncbi:MAG TPA: hypothetical protein PLX06_07060, partial [Fimbriimonadaceae bacterium]|nr:hypothetical protein [Fimbriimonadaceae bacterium]
MSLLLAGILVSSVMIGCSKPDEGSTDTAATTGGAEGKMENKADEAATPDAGSGDAKMEGGEAAGGESKMEGGATPPADGGATPPAEGGETKTG